MLFLIQELHTCPKPKNTRFFIIKQNRIEVFFFLFTAELYYKSLHKLKKIKSYSPAQHIKFQLNGFSYGGDYLMVFHKFKQSFIHDLLNIVKTFEGTSCTVGFMNRLPQ